MDRDSVWATDAEIISTANLLVCDINVYCKVGENINWQRFPAQFTLSQSTDAGLYLENSSADHYDVILSVHSTVITDVQMSNIFTAALN